MGYEKDYTRHYIAKCACGKGFVRYSEDFYSDDWNHHCSEKSEMKIDCNYCIKQYKIEKGYLVPKSDTLYVSFPKPDKKLELTLDEKLVKRYDKSELILMLDDMKKPGHGLIRNLESPLTINYINERARYGGSKRVKKHISALETIINNYDELMSSCNNKEESKKTEDMLLDKYKESFQNILNRSFQLKFELDNDLAQENIEKHKYDDFYARVTYDSTYRRNLENTFWDSYFIEKCIDDEYLVLGKGEDARHITITKKYLCKCTICGRKREIKSCDFKILRHNDESYFLNVYCDKCRPSGPSSFEVKTMDILNRLGVSYIREKKFDGLFGEGNCPLRFDFVLFKDRDRQNEPIIDMAIEVDGPHHYLPGAYDESGEFVENNDDMSGLERHTKHRRLKEEYCKSHNIKLLTIKYTQSSYDQILKTIIAELDKMNYRYLNYKTESDENDEFDLTCDSLGIDY